MFLLLGTGLADLVAAESTGLSGSAVSRILLNPSHTAHVVPILPSAIAHHVALTATTAEEG
jgi:hypothetical protein